MIITTDTAYCDWHCRFALCAISVMKFNYLGEGKSINKYTEDSRFRREDIISVFSTIYDIIRYIPSDHDIKLPDYHSSYYN